MKVLFVCHRFPYPPKRGGKIRPFNIIRHLGGFAKVTVASMARDRAEQDEAQGIADYCHRFHCVRIPTPVAVGRMLMNVPTPVPSSFGYFYSPALKQFIDNECATGDYDFVFVHCSSAAQYVDGFGDLPKILDFGDMDSEKWFEYRRRRGFPMNMVYGLEGMKLRQTEKRLAGRFDLSTCTTRAELQTLRELGTARNTDWFPNGVDSEFFHPDDTPYDSDTLCFTGRMDYFPNQQAVLYLCGDVFPRIRAQVPGAKLLIIGAEPSKEIRQLGERPGITVTGTVPDVRSYVRSAAVSVAPLEIARGTQNKILEAMAMGVPVVSSVVAAGGVDAVPGEHFLTAGDADTLAEQVIGLLQNPARRAELGASGRQRMLANHSWAGSMRRLEGIIERFLGTQLVRRDNNTSSTA